MASNDGKKFEQKLKQDWLKIPNADITRLYDTTNGFKSITNISDFIGYIYPYLFYIECKSTQGNTFPFQRLTQLEKLSKKIGIKGVNPGAIIWFKDHSKVCWVPADEFVRLKNMNYKSINVKMIGDSNFNIYEIPGELKRTFIDSDYSVMVDIARNRIVDK